MNCILCFAATVNIPIVLQSSPTYSPNTKMNILGGNSVLHRSLCFARFSVACSAVHEPEIKETCLIFIIQASVKHKTHLISHSYAFQINSVCGVCVCVGMGQRDRFRANCNYSREREKKSLGTFPNAVNMAFLEK